MRVTDFYNRPVMLLALSSVIFGAFGDKNNFLVQSMEVIDERK